MHCWYSGCGKQYGETLKIKNATTIWFSNLTSGNISKRNENINSKRYVYSHVHSSIIYDTQDMEKTSVSVNGWIGKEVVVYIYNGILFNHKKQGNPTICDNMMNGPWRHYAKWKKSDRDIYSLTNWYFYISRCKNKI